MNEKVFHLMLGENETRILVQHESYEYKCRPNEGVCNSKQKWNHAKCWREHKELDDSSFCKADYTWNHSNTRCKIHEYVDIKNCSCKNMFLNQY